MAQRWMMAWTLVLLPAAAAAQETLELPTVSVSTTVAAGGEEDGLVPLTSITATKTDTPIERTPQSISVVTQESLEQRRPQTLEQAISYVPGVVPSPWGTDNRFAQFLIRGFDVGTYGVFRDGLPQKVIGFSGFAIDPFTLQRVDVLRGPNAVLYGQTDPGGIVNNVTKQPVFAPLRDGFLTYGPFDSWQAGIDIGGPAGQSGTLAWRLTGLYRDGETSLANSYDDRTLIAPALTWQPDSKTTFTLLTNFQKDKTTPAVYLPVAGEDYPAGGETLPGWAWDTSPPGNHYEAEIASVGYLFAHEVSPGLTLRQNLRAMRQKTDYRDFYFNGMTSDTLMNYADFSVRETATTLAIDNQAEIDFTVGGIQNTLLVGLDYSRAEADTSRGYDASYNLSLGDPDLGAARPYPGAYYEGVEVAEQAGLYAHNQSQVTDNLFASFGLRQAWVKNTFDDHLGSNDTSDRDNALVGDVGLVYTFANGFAPYASYSTGFVANDGADFDGDRYKPTDAEQVEVGARYRPDGFNALFSAALFQITKTNVLTTDPDHTGFWKQTGEVRHRGLELEADMTLADGLSAVAAYTYLDAVILSSNDGDQGNRPALVPEHEASLWANYEPGGQLDGLSLGAGVRYVGASFGDTTNLRETPAHTQFDAAIRYRRGALEGSINATNLFDNEYYSICYSGGSCARGDAREVLATLSVSF